ncbi:hypothetical protein ACFWP7_33020 [Streptomyces sp. NPDC058470]|uniref:hypothetical protein n=1 Tax=Streptomyces sp. NPDC058470 TaxID=3346515 RepID=UPI00364B73F4
MRLVGKYGPEAMRIDVYVPLMLPLLPAVVAPQVGARVSPAYAARVPTIAPR